MTNLVYCLKIAKKKEKHIGNFNHNNINVKIFYKSLTMTVFDLLWYGLMLPLPPIFLHHSIFQFFIEHTSTYQEERRVRATPLMVSDKLCLTAAVCRAKPRSSEHFPLDCGYWVSPVSTETSPGGVL